MPLILILLALIGIALTIFKNYLREKRGEAEPDEQRPIAHIKSEFFLEVPIEKVVMGYFVIVALIYSGMLIFNIFLPELDLTILLLSGIIVLLLIYNLVMVVGIVRSFSWRIFILLVLSGLILGLVFLRPEVTSIDLLEDAFPYTLTVHILGVVLGLGGAIILDMMIFHFLRNFSISKREAVIMHLLSQMIVFGLILLIVSGFALFFTDVQGYLENPRFLMKMTAVFVVLLNGIVLNLYVAPKMELISLHKEARERNQTLINVSFTVGAISATSWFSVFFLAMLNILETFSYSTLLIVYLILLALTICAGWFTKYRYEKSAIEQKI